MAEARVRRPALQHYPGDEERETGLKLVGLAAFGLWRRMINLMHVGEPYGFLTTPESGTPIGPAELARLLGESPASIKRLLAQLEAHKVFSRTGEGVIYSRRMVRDERTRNNRASGGHLSLRNPAVPRPKDGRKDADKDPQLDTFGTSEGYPSPPSLGGSPSSSSSSSKNPTPTPSLPEGGEGNGAPSGPGTAGTAGKGQGSSSPPASKQQGYLPNGGWDLSGEEILARDEWWGDTPGEVRIRLLPEVMERRTADRPSTMVKGAIAYVLAAHEADPVPGTEHAAATGRGKAVEAPGAGRSQQPRKTAGAAPIPSIGELLPSHVGRPPPPTEPPPMRTPPGTGAPAVVPGVEPQPP